MLLILKFESDIIQCLSRCVQNIKHTDACVYEYKMLRIHCTEDVWKKNVKKRRFQTSDLARFVNYQR